MQRIHKVAIARIFSDLIKADRIIDTGEMECWEKICSKYGIDSDIQVEAASMTFAEGIHVISSADDKRIASDFLEDCREMTVSDGFCAHPEALIMITLMLALNPYLEMGVEVISIPRANFNIDLATALYIENDYDEGINEAIRQNHRVIFKEFQLAGFHFVYLPNIIDHYKRTDPILFKRILSFLAPSISHEGIGSVYHSLMRMTTGDFCKDILCNKCGISELRSTYPSLLIKISNSFVGELPYSNYLKIEVAEDIVEMVQRFVDSFCDLQNSDVYVVNTSEEKDNQFHFHGFYKQLLDIFLVRKNIRSTVLIDPYRSEISFPEIDAKASGIHRRERALYALLLCQGKDGVSFKLPRNREAKARYERRIERLQKRYAIIYEMFGGDRELAPDLSVPEIRRPIFACLRRALKNLSGLYNPEDYTISSNKEGIFSVNIEPSLINVRQLDSENPVPLHDSLLYKRVEAI